MRSSILQSELAEQLYTCTDKYARSAAQTAFCGSAPTTPPTAAPSTSTRSSAPWFPHRALHTLRQAGLQMRPWPRPWAQVLPLRQSLPTAAANGLHSAKLLPRRRRVLGQLPSPSPDLGRDLRHQSRVVAPARGTLRNSHESIPPYLTPFRCRTGQPPPRQHARRMARPSSRRHGGRP